MSEGKRPGAWTRPLREERAIAQAEEGKKKTRTFADFSLQLVFSKLEHVKNPGSR